MRMWRRLAIVHISGDLFRRSDEIPTMRRVFYQTVFYLKIPTFPLFFLKVYLLLCTSTTVHLSNRELFIEIGLYDKILVPRNVMTFVCLLIRQKNFLTPSVGQECVVGFKFNFFYNQANL